LGDLEGFLVVVPEDFQDVQQLLGGLWVGCLGGGFVVYVPEDFQDVQ
jgi:hypothetical protein